MKKLAFALMGVAISSSCFSAGESFAPGGESFIANYAWVPTVVTFVAPLVVIVAATAAAESNSTPSTTK